MIAGLSIAARLGQTAVVLVVLAAMVYGANRQVQRRAARLAQNRRDFLDHLRRWQEP